MTDFLPGNSPIPRTTKFRAPSVPTEKISSRNSSASVPAPESVPLLLLPLLLTLPLLPLSPPELSCPGGSASIGANALTPERLIGFQRTRSMAR